MTPVEKFIMWLGNGSYVKGLQILNLRKCNAQKEKS